MGRKAKKETPTVLLVTALDGTFNKQAWADHFAATLSAHARDTKPQADILRAICAAYKLFQLASCSSTAAATMSATRTTRSASSRRWLRSKRRPS